MARTALNSTDPVTKRVHVGGLAPSVQPKDLVQRFSSFGTVLGGENGVHGLGKTATGLPRSFAFFSIETTEAQFARCLSMLNGSMWKAHKLRIAPAKPDWQQRRAEEREQAAKEAENPAARPKKRKRASKDVNIGIPASHFELVTPDNMERHRGWVLDPKPAPQPLFPLIVRPSHPVDPPPQPAQTAWSRGTAKAKPSKAAREALRAGVSLEKPALRRAKRIRIDPRRWGRKRVLFDVAAPGAKGTKADDSSATMLAVGMWECEGPAEGDDDAEPAVTWVFKTRDGQVRRRETVRLTQRSVPHTDRFTTLLEGLARPAASTTAAPSAAPTTAPAAMQGEAYRSPSPPPYVPVAPRNLIYNEEDAFQLIAAALDDSERDAAHAMERAAYRQLALGTLEEVGAMDEIDEVEEEGMHVDAPALPKVEGFAADSDDDNDLFATLRLRGGGGGDVESSDSESSSDSDSDSSSDEDADDDASSTVKQSSSSDEPATAVVQPKASLQDTLTSLFKPSASASAPVETGGFSLFANMDLDLDADAARTPSPEPLAIPLDSAPGAYDRAAAAAASFPGQRFVPPPARDGGYRGGAATPRFAGPSRAFFPYPAGAFTGTAGADADADADAALQLLAGAPGASDKLARAASESAARVEAAARDFYRREGQDEIDAEHQAMRELLRGHARKRHREAVKRTKKGAPGRQRGAAVKLDLLDDE
ncbi:hypothetical protein JCM3770_005932 [Rhodotorula araucariae]